MMVILGDELWSHIFSNLILVITANKFSDI